MSSVVKIVSEVGGAVTLGVVGVVEDQNDSSAATPRFTNLLSERIGSRAKAD
jgi:hypothetical protein